MFCEKFSGLVIIWKEDGGRRWKVIHKKRSFLKGLCFGVYVAFSSSHTTTVMFCNLNFVCASAALGIFDQTPRLASEVGELIIPDLSSIRHPYSSSQEPRPSSGEKRVSPRPGA
jgi:hypothetical protein